MSRHLVSGRWRLGLALALATALLWATLPVALKVSLERLDPYTVTWARFAFCAAVVLAWMVLRGQLRVFIGRPRRAWGLLALAGLMLIANYVLYLLGLDYTTPANAQLLIQAAPLLMALGGIFVFRERFSFWQWLGFAAIWLGLLLFFLDQRQRPAEAGSAYALGSALIVLAALVWAVYALAQKQLLMHWSSTAVLLVIYVMATVLLLPWASPSTLLTLDRVHGWALLYCAVNTLAAYGAFAEALAHWEASRVSTVLALTPLFTMATVALGHQLAPGYVRALHVDLVGWLGALAVVVGSIVTASMRGKPAASET
jgi:drug/metabolite transporter (DMT)-like permease